MSVPKKAILPPKRENIRPKKICVICCILLISIHGSCSFDYGENEESDNDQPDIVMENVEYVRVKSADPVARFFAERAERYENRRLMEILKFSFEQFGERGEEVNAFGNAGAASVEIDSGDVRMSDGVWLEVESEDMKIETGILEWKDKEHTLVAGKDETVNVYQANGTSFTGIGFYADARRRTWEFSGGVSGIFVSEDEEEAAEDGLEEGE